jgi:arginase
MRQIKIIGINSEIGSGTRGASLGMDAIKIAAWNFMSDLFKKIPTQIIQDENDLIYEPVECSYAKRIEGIYAIYERVAKSVCSAILSKEFPILLAGDHSTSGATIAGIKMANPKSRLGAVWFGAHADLHSPFTTTSGNLNGMPLAISIAEDNIENKKNDPDDKTREYWEKLKNIGQIAPKILPQDLIYVGLRDIEREEKEVIDRLNIKVITVAEVRKKGIENISKQIYLHLHNCDEIYVSFDADSIDSSISRGTSLPVNNGFKQKEVEDLIASLIQYHKICCLEIAEVNPTLDKENSMAEIAFSILQRSINLYFGVSL